MIEKTVSGSAGSRQRGREVWSMKTQYLSEEVMIP